MFFSVQLRSKLTFGEKLVSLVIANLMRKTHWPYDHTQLHRKLVEVRETKMFLMFLKNRIEKLDTFFRI